MLMLNFADGQEPIPAVSVTLRRALGAPAAWRTIVLGHQDTLGGTRVASLANGLTHGLVDVWPSWEGDGGGELGPHGRIVGIDWRRGRLSGFADELDYLDIVADITLPKTDKDPFSPRWRVHRVPNVKALLDLFADLVTPTQGVKNVLERIQFPDADKATIIQAGESDWTFVQMILRQAAAMAGHVSWNPLTLVGGMQKDDDTAGKWVVTPGGRAAYDEWGDTQGRKLRQPNQREERIHFGSVDGAGRVPEFPAGRYPSVSRSVHGLRFDADDWKLWSQRDLPVFDWHDAFIVRVEDTLYRSGQLQELLWQSDLWMLPPGCAMPLATDPNPPERNLAAMLRPWLGRAVVQTYSAAGPWIEAKLHGFENGADVAHVRLTTPYSGLDGKTGLHTVPEDQSEIVIGWSGRLSESVLLLENVRLEAAKFVSPSLWLDKDWKGRFEKLEISEIGRVKVDSEYAMELAKRTSLQAQGDMQLKGDGAEVRLKGGVVRTGRAV